MVGLFSNEILVLDNGQIWQTGDRIEKRLGTIKLDKGEKLISGVSLRFLADGQSIEILTFAKIEQKSRFLIANFDFT